MTEPSSLGHAGLFATDGTVAPVPLIGVSIEAEIAGLCARVAVAHRYANREAVPIEATYLFPLEEGAAVGGFEVVVDGTLVIGEVRERDAAFDAYDDAMAHGHGAFLLDEERPDVFQASIGNLPPGKEVLVRITYVSELTIDGGRVRFTIPTTVSPRYAPAEDRTGIGRPDSEALNPPLAWAVPYGLDLSVRLSVPGGVTAVESPSHPVSIALGADAATVRLAQSKTALDRDFVLLVDAAGMDAPGALIERGDDGSEAIAVTFVPRFTTDRSPSDIVFVVDRSGSMEGTSIEEVRRALQLCLRSMIPGCRFNIVGFGSSCQALFGESRAYDQSSLAEASAHVATLKADLGGTEILQALQLALRQPPHAELPRQLVVLTDGEVTNTDAVLSLAKSHAAAARIFTFGIGAGASQHLVRGLARAGRGSAEFIHPGERIEPTVMRVFERLLSPACGNVAIEWVGGSRVVQAPIEPAPVFAGSRLIVYGFTTGSRPRAVRLSGTGPSGPFHHEIPLDSAPVVDGRAIAPLAARARIRELEEGYEWLTSRGSRQRDRKQGGVRDEIVALSTRYGVISRETSFVAIERRETPVQGDVQLRRVPVALTSGWGALEERSSVAYAPIQDAVWMSAACDSVEGELYSLEADPPDTGGPSPSRSYLSHALSPGWSVGAAVPPRSRTAAPSTGMDALVALQAADGSWDLDAAFAAAIGRPLVELEAALGGAAEVPGEARRAWATALALAWLETRAAEAAGEWRMLGAKARRWLDQTAAVPPGGWTWIDTARQFL